LTRDKSKRDFLRELGALPVVADALNRTEIMLALQAAEPDVVIHELTAIGEIDTRRMERDFAATNRLRTTGADFLLAAARAAGVKRFIAQSHVAAYARTGGPLKSEEDPVDRAAGALRENAEAMQYLERIVLAAAPIDGIVLRYGWFYGPGTSMAANGATAELVRHRKFPVIGKGTAIWSFVHIGDAADATVAAVDHGSPGIYNIVDDDPAPVCDWLPELAKELGARKPFHVPRLLGKLLAGEAGVAMMTELRGATNGKAKRELGWSPRHTSWRNQLSAT
jgi:nucleoside-diphosphate-sugar epimerase